MRIQSFSALISAAEKLANENGLKLIGFVELLPQKSVSIVNEDETFRMDLRFIKKENGTRHILYEWKVLMSDKKTYKIYSGKTCYTYLLRRYIKSGLQRLELWKTTRRRP